MKSLALVLMIGASILDQRDQRPLWLCDYELIAEITPYTVDGPGEDFPGFPSLEELLSTRTSNPRKPATAFGPEDFFRYVTDIARETEARRGPSIFEKTEPTKVVFETHSRGEIEAMTAIVSNARVGVGGPRIFTQLSQKEVTCGTWETYRKPF